VSINYFYNLRVPIPPLKEQIQIANYLNEKTQKIDNITQIISKKNRATKRV
jgi:restriction endonuclease S subunit